MRKEISDSTELRSEEIQDMIGRIPSFIEQYGIIIITIIVFILIVGTYFFKYPDTLEAPIVITNSIQSPNIVSRTDGNIEYINNNNGGYVSKGDLLAIISSTTNYKDLIWLKDLLNKKESQEISLEDFIKLINRTNLKLGNIQHYYVSLQNVTRTIYHYYTNQYYKRKIGLILERLNKYNNIETKKQNRNAIQERSEKINNKIFLRDSILHISGILSEEDYEKAIQKHITIRKNSFDREIDKIQSNLQRLNDEEAILELYNEHFLKESHNEQEFNSTLQELEMAIKKWEETYVLKSPISGTINIMGIYGKNKFIPNGETLFIITPQKKGKPIGKALLPALGVGKIKKGQKVIVYVNNFPENEFGNLIGCVNEISNTPTTDGKYIVDIIFPNGLNTVFHKELPNSQQFMGNAKIIIRERRLIELFIQNIKLLLNNV